jgi:hypothetical protein
MEYAAHLLELLSLSPSLLPNLIDYYKFDENTGSSVGDSVGSKNGTWGGTLGAQWGTGKINTGGVFNGSDNKVTPSVWSTAIANISFSVWFNSSDYTRNRQVIWSNGDGAVGHHGYALVLSGDATTDGSMYLLSHNFIWQPLNFKVQDALWHHAVVTINPTGRLIVFLDNVVRYADIATTLFTPDTNSLIGADNNGTGGFFKGSIDEMGIWNDVLSSADVNFLYNGGNGRQSPFSSSRIPAMGLLGAG